MTEFVFEIPNFLDKIVCDDIIKKFEEDKDKSPGKIGHRSGNVDETIKKSTDLRITFKRGWLDQDNYLCAKVSEGLELYRKHIESIFGDAFTALWAYPLFNNTRDTGFQLQRVGKGGFYTWHHDSNLIQQRTMGFIFYLNTMEEGEGGTTDFRIGSAELSIRPEAGKAIFFPTAWPYVHTGREVLVDHKCKYICTGFMVPEEIVV